MYSVEVQMLCCREGCVDTLECNQLFASKESAKKHLTSLKRQIRDNSCCQSSLMMTEEYQSRQQHFLLTVTTPAKKTVDGTIIAP